MKAATKRSLLPTVPIALHRFLVWWTGQLSWFVPGRWRRGGPSRFEAREDRDHVRLSVVQSRGPTRVAQLAAGRLDPPDFLTREKSSANLPVWLFPSADNVLARRVQVPASAASQFASLLNLEIDRWSPYQIDEVYASWAEVAQDGVPRGTFDLRLIPRAVVETTAADLSKLGLKISYLVLGDGKPHQIDLRPRSAGAIGPNGVLVLTMVLLFFVLMAADWLVASRHLTAWQGRYQAELKALGSQRALEDKIAKAVANIERASGSVSKGRFLAQLSAAIPETDWLTEVIVKKETVTVRGYAANLERLTKALEPLARDRALNLQSELMNDGRSNLQRFEIAFRPAGA